MNNIASWIWVLIPLAAIGIAPFKMWLRIKEKQIDVPDRTWRPRRALNMPSTWSGSKRDCACSSRSPPIRASRPRPRSKPCGTSARIPTESKLMNPFEFVIAIIFLTGIFALVRQRMGVRHIWERPANEDNPETVAPAR